MWYSKLYRRHLCDMHIDDWDERFLSEFSPENYVELLMTAKINDAMIYLQAHTGLCYFPTKTGVMHKALIGREDLLGRTVDLARQNGIKVMGYYSLIHNTAEHDRHPEWRMLREDGRSRRAQGVLPGKEDDPNSFRGARYGFCCLNNAEYTEFVYRQIDEMLAYFSLDGLFFDMPFWPHVCHCAACEARYFSEFGVPLPKEKPAPGTREYTMLAKAYYRWMGEWVQGITDYIREKAPELAIEYNFASAIAGNSLNGCGEEVNAASDYSGGDLYGGIRNHSFTCKFYKNITRNQPFEYMFSRAKPGLSSHTLTKTLDEMKTAIAVTMSHHGATFVIDALDPVGTMDRRVYERVGEMFAYQMPYEPYFRGDMVEDVGIYYGIRSRVDVNGEGRSSTKACVAISDALIRRHVPFGVTGNFHRLEGYRAIFAPLLSEMEEGDNARLCEYVRSGGTLYLSGAGNASLVEELTGGTIVGRTSETRLYVAPKEAYSEVFGGFNEKYPLPFSGHATLLRCEDTDAVAATLTYPYTSTLELRYASIHSNPPGKPSDHPALVVKRYGKGWVIWSALPLELGETEEYGDILWSLIRSLMSADGLSYTSTAPGYVEHTLFRSEDELLFNSTALTDGAEAYPVAPFTVSVRCDRVPRAVTLVPTGEDVAFRYENGYVTFETRTLQIYDLYRIVL